ncbi:hypothetical protein [Hyphomonas atlantica corrig.]|uniref:hypothetical protein n=1 Tax=Hyphomonas atlantica TaxID=1280948 RepID=UPI0023568918|nr:hypothetical protein [Hyphomonas atlantica]
MGKKRKLTLLYLSVGDWATVVCAIIAGVTLYVQIYKPTSSTGTGSPVINDGELRRSSKATEADDSMPGEAASTEIVDLTVLQAGTSLEFVRQTFGAPYRLGRNGELQYNYLNYAITFLHDEGGLTGYIVERGFGDSFDEARKVIVKTHFGELDRINGSYLVGYGGGCNVFPTDRGHMYHDGNAFDPAIGLDCWGGNELPNLRGQPLPESRAIFLEAPDSPLKKFLYMNRDSIDIEDFMTKYPEPFCWVSVPRALDRYLVEDGAVFQEEVDLLESSHDYSLENEYADFFFSFFQDVRVLEVYLADKPEILGEVDRFEVFSYRAAVKSRGGKPESACWADPHFSAYFGFLSEAERQYSQLRPLAEDVREMVRSHFSEQSSLKRVAIPTFALDSKNPPVIVGTSEER